MSEFGARLKELRKTQKITQRDLAAQVGVDFTYISKIESSNSKMIPADETIKKLANALNANYDELMFLAKKIPTDIQNNIIADDLAIAFLRTMPNFTDDQKNEIKKIIRGVKK